MLGGKFYPLGKQAKTLRRQLQSPPLEPERYSPPALQPPSPLGPSGSSSAKRPGALRGVCGPWGCPVPVMSSTSHLQKRPSNGWYGHRHRAHARPPESPSTTRLERPPLPSRRAEPPRRHPAALQGLLNMESAGEKRFLFGLNPPKWNGEGRGGEEGRAAPRVNPLWTAAAPAKAPGVGADSLTETDWQLPRRTIPARVTEPW